MTSWFYIFDNYHTAPVACFIYFVKVKAEVSKVCCSYGEAGRGAGARHWDGSNSLSCAVCALGVSGIGKQKGIKPEMSQTVNKISVSFWEILWASWGCCEKNWHSCCCFFTQSGWIHPRVEKGSPVFPIVMGMGSWVTCTISWYVSCLSKASAFKSAFKGFLL